MQRKQDTPTTQFYQFEDVYIYKMKKEIERVHEKRKENGFLIILSNPKYS